MSTINQAAVGNQLSSYGTQTGSLLSYLLNSTGNFLDNGLAGKGWNFSSAFGDPSGKIFNSKLNDGQSITGFDSGIGAAAGLAGRLLDKSAAHQRTSGKYGHVAQTVDSVADAVGMVGNYNPLATGLGRLGMGAVNKITGGTDGMTVQDSLLGSSAVQGTLTGIAAATGPVGWGVAGAYLLASGINAATGKTTTDNAYKSFMDKDKLTDVSSGYTDMDLENEAQQLYNKKYGGFSRGAYRKAQKKIDQAQMLMTDKIDIRDTAKLGQIRAGMVDANNIRYLMAINGGYKPMAIGREGLKITPKRLKEAKEIAKCIRKKRSAKFNVIPSEAREAMRDVTKMPSDVMPTFRKGGRNYVNGQRVDTTQCAKFSNRELRDRGYTLTYGDAWNLKNQDLVYSGYDKSARPLDFDLNLVVKYNHDAADRLYKEFDSKTLDKDSVYTVNMYYNGSPAQETAYKEGRDNITGTHTGYLQFNRNSNRWEVVHNIHGTVHVDPFINIQGSKGKYGVTAIYKPRETNVWNKFRGMLGFEEGGEINYFQNGGTVNVIPEGALHARKHHMEDDEHITKKGIPVVDVNGKQLAEIERNEIIFRKEVTSELEKLFKDGSDEAAIEAGKLLAKEIIENTDDRTGLIQEVTGEPKLNHEVIPSAKLGANLGGLLKEGTSAEDVMGIVQKGINVFKSGKEAKKKEQEIQDKLNLKNLENSLKVSESFAELNRNIMNNGPAEVATTENGYVATTKPLPEVVKPEISNTTDKSLLDLVAEYIKTNQLKTDNAPTSSNSNNLAALIQGALDLLKTKKKADETEIPSTATPTLAQEGKKLPEFNTFFDLKNYLNETGRGSDEDYDLEAAYNDPEVYGYWREEEEKNPGKGHWLDKYKKDSHMTYSVESILGDNPKENGGRWVNADGKDLFIVSPYLENKHSLWDYLDYFINNEPNVSFRYKGVTYSTGRKKK